MAGCLHVSPSEPTGTVYQLASFKHCNCSFDLRSLTPLAINGLSGNKPEYLSNLAKIELKMALIASLSFHTCGRSMAPRPREWPPRGALKGFASQITANELMDVMRKIGRAVADKPRRLRLFGTRSWAVSTGCLFEKDMACPALMEERRWRLAPQKSGSPLVESQDPHYFPPHEVATQINSVRLKLNAKKTHKSTFWHD